MLQRGEADGGGSEGEVGVGVLACWHRSEFNTAAHLFSHLHRPKRHVTVADVEQADSLREQPTKTESELVNTRNTPVLREYQRVATTVRINPYIASTSS